MVADASGQVISEALYSTFGEIRYQNGTLTTDYLYTGQRQEAEIGLYYYVARWYDPAIGRFIQADSIVPVETQGLLAWDRYAYVNNNPIQYTDPTGHSVVLTLLALAGAGAAIGAAVQAGYQVYEQWDSNQSLIENVQSANFDVGKIGGAAAGGAAFGVLSTVASAGFLAVGTAGATTSLGTAITTVASGGGGLLPSIFGGLVGGAASTPFSALTESAIEQRSTTGSVSGTWENAVNNGSLDPNEWATNGFSGGIAGGLGYIGGKIISDITWVPRSMSGTPWPVTTQGYGESSFSFAIRQFTNRLKSSTGYSMILNTSFEVLNEVLQSESQMTIDDLLRTPLPQ
jgi:RHS repeat-associated protein